MASYSGPATIVSRQGEIDVTVDLCNRTDLGGCPIWSGHLDRCDRTDLRLAMNDMDVYGLIIRFPNGREGNFMPSPETTWSRRGINIHGFLRGSQRSDTPALVD